MMTFEARLTCDALGCYNRKNLSDEYDEIELKIEEVIFPTGKWLEDLENGTHYCPKHAFQVAKELGLEYAK